MLNGRLDSKSSHTTRVGQDVPVCKIRQIHKIANNTKRGVLLEEAGHYFLLQSVDSSPLVGIDLTA